MILNNIKAKGIGISFVGKQNFTKKGKYRISLYFVLEKGIYKNSTFLHSITFKNNIS